MYNYGISNSNSVGMGDMNRAGITKTSKTDLIIPASLKSNALALYTTRSTGLRDFFIDVENKIVNGDFAVDSNSDGVADGWAKTGTAVVSFVPGQETITPSARYDGIQYVANTTVGDKLFAIAIVDSTDINTAVQLGSGTVVKAVVGVDKWVYTSYTAIAITTAFKIFSDATVSWVPFKAKRAMLVNLTAIFGAGNEPTGAEFYDMLVYKSKAFWSGTEKVVINPYDKYYWPDRSGNGRHLHFVNLAYDTTGGLQAGPPNNYLFDGINDYAIFNSASDIVASNTSFSVFVIFQAKDTVQSTHRFVNLSNGAANNIMGLFYTGGALVGSISDSVSGSSVPSSVGVLNANSWYASSVSYSPTNKKAAFSKNNSAIVEGSALTNGTLAITKFLISTSPSLALYNNNRFSEIYIFNKTLTQSEITSLIKNLKTQYGNIG